MLKPRNTKVVVIQRKTAKVGSILIATVDRQADKFAEVLAVGPDVEDIKVGDIVYADISAGSLVEDNDDGLTGILDESDILAIKE